MDKYQRQLLNLPPLRTFMIRAEARVSLAPNSKRVVWIGKIKAVDHYIAGDRVKDLLKVRRGVYHVILRFGEEDQRVPSPEAAAIVHRAVQEVEDAEY